MSKIPAPSIPWYCTYSDSVQKIQSGNLDFNSERAVDGEILFKGTFAKYGIWPYRTAEIRAEHVDNPWPSGRRLEAHQEV